MPIIYKCGGCGEIIYVFHRVGQDSFGVPTPEELFYKVGSKCPKCGKPFKIPTYEDIVILGRTKKVKDFNAAHLMNYRVEAALTQP